MALAREQRRDLRFAQAAQLLESAENLGARARLAHDPGGRGLAAQGVVDEAGDRRAVAGAGEAAREPPVLERVGGRTAARLDVGEDFDGGGDAGGGDHRQVFPGKRGRRKSDTIGGLKMRALRGRRSEVSPGGLHVQCFSIPDRFVARLVARRLRRRAAAPAGNRPAREKAARRQDAVGDGQDVLIGARPLTPPRDSSGSRA